MDNCKVKDNCILPQEIIMLASLDLIKKKVGDRIIGRERSQMCMKDSLREESEMEEEHFGGQMEVGMKVISRMEFKADLEYCIDKEETSNIRVFGIMACSMEKEFNTLIMVRDTRVVSSRISSMGMAFSTKTIL
jgi:hypothetical protein